MPNIPAPDVPESSKSPHSVPKTVLACAWVWLSMIACGATEDPGKTPAPSAGPSVAEILDTPLTFIDPAAASGSLAAEWSAGGGLWLSWLEPQPEGHRLVASQWTDGQWQPVNEVARGAEIFANWADRPSLVASRRGLGAHWLEKLAEHTYAYGVQTTSRDDHGTWRPGGLLHDDASATEHGFVSYAVADDGTTRAFWLDGRQMAEGGDMQLRTADLNFGAGGRPPESEVLDPRVCECCDTDAAWTSEGPLVVYRDRDADELRDIAIVRRQADGWSEPVLIHADGWKIEGCPVNGPAIEARDQRVAVAWFTAARDPLVQVAFSNDAGAGFSPPTPVSPGPTLGRIDLVLTESGDALVSWVALLGDSAEIHWRRVSPDGHRGPIHRVAPMDAGRSGGVPRLMKRGDHLYFAWLEAVGSDKAESASQGSRLRVAFHTLK